jgi:hypothetical protein
MKPSGLGKTNQKKTTQSARESDRAHKKNAPHINQGKLAKLANDQNFRKDC